MRTFEEHINLLKNNPKKLIKKLKKELKREGLIFPTLEQDCLKLRQRIVNNPM